MKSRRYFLVQSTLATTGILMAKPFTLFGSGKCLHPLMKDNKHSVTLLHTNDLHNYLEPHNYEKYTNLGGFKNTVQVISKIKKENASVVLVDAGDIFCGNTMFQQEHTTTLQMMQAAGYDAALLGNRDYIAGTDYLLEQNQKNQLPLIASNYKYTESCIESLHQPYKIIQRGVIKIGIIGAGIDMKELAPPNLSYLVQYKDPVKQLSAIATMLKQEKNCQLVVCLSHLGYKNNKAIDDITLATQSKDIDVIIGGHSHTFMQAPHIVLNQQQNEVVINHAGYGGMVLGNMNFTFDDSGNKSGVSFNNLVIGTKNNVWEHKQQINVMAG